MQNWASPNPAYGTPGIKRRLKKWYGTPAGIAYREEREAKIKNLRREVLNTHRDTTSDVHRFIYQHLGKQWRVRVIGERAMTIELLRDIQLMA